MAKINFDHIVDGQPETTFGLDFDAMTPEQMADVLGLDAQSGAKLVTASQALGLDAKGQAILQKLVATAVVVTERTLAGGGSTAGLIAGILA